MSFRRSVQAMFVIIVSAIVIRAVITDHLPPYGKMLAQIGVAVGVAPNPYNTLDAELNAKQQQLDAERSALNAKENTIASATAASAAVSSPIDWYLVAAVAALAALVSANFYFDWRRGRSSGTEGAGQ